MPNNTHRDVAIIGAGIVGLITALLLARRQLQVTLFCGDHTSYGSTTDAAGAMLCVLSEVSHETDERDEIQAAAYRLSGSQLMSNLLNDYSISPESINLRQGVFLVANPRGGVGDLASLRRAKLVGKELGLPVEDVSVEEIYAKEFISGYAPQPHCFPTSALYLPSDASVDARALRKELLRACSECQNIQLIYDRVQTCVPGSLCTIHTNQGSKLDFERVVMCCGAETETLLRQCGDRNIFSIPTIFSGRGVALLLTPEGLNITNAIRTPNRGFACGIHAVPCVQGKLYVGATNRLNLAPDFASKPTLSECFSLLEGAISEINTGLSEAHIDEMRVGFRPVSARKLPIVGPAGPENIFVCTATYRNGLVLAPLLASLLEQSIFQGNAEIDHIFWSTYQNSQSTNVNAKQQKVDGVAISLAEALLEPYGQLPPHQYKEVEALYQLVIEEIIGDSGKSINLRAAKRLLDLAPMAEAWPGAVRTLLKRR